MELPLYALAEVHGKFTVEPSPAVFAAPAAVCTPIERGHYSDVSTERPGRTPRPGTSPTATTPSPTASPAPAPSPRPARQPRTGSQWN
ncbi:hypothetical protein ACFV2U_39930 [Streptomyces sp. NPDC059697]|uniref:hypothetical protein n=1 Tax=Streptomyces sp. NPDC059697 TaxID=3346912 RepID=UPI00367B0974